MPLPEDDLGTWRRATYTHMASSGKGCAIGLRCQQSFASDLYATRGKKRARLISYCNTHTENHNRAVYDHPNIQENALD